MRLNLINHNCTSSHDSNLSFQFHHDAPTLNCDRDSQGNVYYADMSASIVRPRCLENIKEGLLPQKWMGKKIAPIPSWGGGDVDY